MRTDLNPYRQLDIVRTVGVVRFVGNREGPLAVRAEAVESLRIMVASDQGIVTGHRLRKGDRVLVTTGPFAGVVGTFVRYRGHSRVVVNIEALGQYAAVEVDMDNLEPLPRHPGLTPAAPALQTLACESHNCLTFYILSIRKMGTWAVGRPSLRPVALPAG